MVGLVTCNPRQKSRVNRKEGPQMKAEDTPPVMGNTLLLNGLRSCCGSARLSRGLAVGSGRTWDEALSCSSGWMESQDLT